MSSASATPKSEGSSTPMESEDLPVASTSQAGGEEMTASESVGAEGKKKRKKLPSCDACKLRRVLCLPVAPPLSCPRCVDKGIQCTTTPTVRKKPTSRSGKRILEARATFGTADTTSPHLATPSNTPWIQPRIQPRATTSSTLSPSVSAFDVESRLSTMQLNGDLAAELIQAYQHLPQSWLPLLPRGRLLLQFEEAGRRLEVLSPHSEVLARTIMALTCRLSSNPLIIGEGTPIEFEKLTPAYLSQGNHDLREYGQRREAVCESLRQSAVKLAWERGVLVDTSEETMACCNLLEILEGRINPQRGKPYGSAFVSHLRALLDEPVGSVPRTINMPLGWSALMMREAHYAANAGRMSHFTLADDTLLCGPVPVSIEEAILDTVDDVDVRDSVTLFFKPMRPYTYHATRLSRESSDKVFGTAAKKEPLDERFVTKFLTQLDHLYHLFSILSGRISFVLSPAATSAHALPAPFEQERKYIMQACLYTIQLGWASLSLPVYLDLKRRIQDLISGPPSTLAERRRSRERLETLLKQVHRSALKGARLAAAVVHGAPSLTFLTELRQERLDAWIEILADARTVEEGGEGITQAEKTTELQWMLDGLKTMGYAWSGDDELIQALETRMATLQVGDQTLPMVSAAPVAPSTLSIDAGPSSSFLDFLPPAGLDFMSSNLQIPASMAGGDLPILPGGMPFDLDALLTTPLFGGGGSLDTSLFAGFTKPEGEMGGDLDWVSMDT